MSTVAPGALNRVYDLILPRFSSAKRGGIANPASPGYHTSREDLIRQGRGADYSVQCPADRRGKASNAAGIDITFGLLSELVTIHTRLRVACTPDSKGEYDPRIECVREIIGTLDGRNVSGYNRVATGTGSRSRVGWHASGYSDSSHLWHEHISVLRDRVDDDNEMRGLAEVIAGVPAGTFGWSGGGEYVWDGKSFPGAARFGPDAEGPWIAYVIGRLAAHGYEPALSGSAFTAAVRDGVRWFQERQGWRGGDADGVPGAETWTRLGEAPSTYYWVDPAKVTSELLGLDRPGGAGSKVLRRWKPRERIRIRKVVTGPDGRRWALAPDDTYYSMEYLTDKEPAEEDKGPPAPAPPTEPKPGPTYTVQPGDTLSGIARRLGVGWRDLAALNPGLDPDRLSVGQIIRVPAAVPDPPKEEPAVATIRVCSTNMLDDTLASAKSHPWSQRKAGYIAAVQSTEPDVVLVQEATSRQMGDLCAGLKGDWTWWRSDDTSRDKGPLAVAWRQAVLERTGPGRTKHLESNRAALAVPLRHEATGREFTAVVTHLDNGSTLGDLRTRQAAAAAEWLPGPNDKSASEALVFGADLNDRRTGSTGPRAELRKAGIVLIRDAVTVPGAEYESHHGWGALSKGVGWIDDAGARGLTITRAGVVRTDRAAPVKAHRNVSDHNILWFAAEL